MYAPLGDAARRLWPPSKRTLLSAEVDPRLRGGDGVAVISVKLALPDGEGTRTRTVVARAWCIRPDVLTAETQRTEKQDPLSVPPCLCG
jgi:hypothetical protein